LSWQLRDRFAWIVLISGRPHQAQKINPIATNCDMILRPGKVGKNELSFSNTTRQ